MYISQIYDRDRESKISLCYAAKKEKLLILVCIMYGRKEKFWAPTQLKSKTINALPLFMCPSDNRTPLNPYLNYNDIVVVQP